MTKQRKQFSPHIYQEWGELFDAISTEERSEILLGITKFPEYEPKNVPIWNFIKSQLQKDYENFVEKCKNNSTIIKNYWNKKKQKDTNVNERITNENECIPKRITNNELLLTKTETEKIKILNRTIEKIYGYPFNLKSKSSDTVIKEIISDKEFGLCVEDVLKHFKYKYDWGDKGKPYLDWLFQDSTNWFKVKQDCITKGGNCG